ncbi:MAG: YebC/PmpR family DNA-binding transcriptional regulator [bacterium]
MSGHSKWATIKRKKGAIDAKRGQLFGKIIKEITIAARNGSDLAANPRLRAAVQTARANNLPIKNIDNAINKAASKDASTLEEVGYEGYGPGGVAMLIEAVTDNRNRTVGEIRNILSKRGGSMADAGSVSYIFKTKGVISVDVKSIDEDKILELVLDAGAEDMQKENEFYEITTEIADFERVKNILGKNNISISNSEITKIAESVVKLTGEPARKIIGLVEALEDHDDVQRVHANFDIDFNELENISA